MNTPRHLEHDWFPRPLPDNVTLGERSWCYSSFAFLHDQRRKNKTVHIGRDTGIYHGTYFDLGPESEVMIGDYCTLVGAIISVNCRVCIGNYCFFAHEVVLADAPAATPDHHVSCSTSRDGIVFEDNCWVGMRATIIAPARIGEGAIIGAAAVVNFDVPPYAIVAGNPAAIVGWAKKPGDGPTT